MKGLASPETMTGKLQRALTGQWQTQAELHRAAGLDHKQTTVANAQQCLERLVREGRAATGFVSIANSGGLSYHRVSVYRRLGAA